MKELERKYAEFHRKLGELLTGLLEDADIFWAADILQDGGDTGHVLRETGENDYHKAVYLLSSPLDYRERLEELSKVQEEAFTLSGLETLPRGLLLPERIEDVGAVRVRVQEVFTHSDMSVERAKGVVSEDLNNLIAATRKFEAYGQDDRTRALYEKIGRLKTGLEGFDRVEEVLLRYRRPRLHLAVYTNEPEPLKPYLRDVGLILVGPRIDWNVDRSRRKRRSDRVTEEDLSPIVAYDSKFFYDAVRFKEASEEKRKGLER